VPLEPTSSTRLSKRLQAPWTRLQSKEVPLNRQLSVFAVAALTAAYVITPMASQPFTCAAAEWGVQNGLVKCRCPCARCAHAYLGWV
jgi:hypothetical protein